MKGRKAVPYAVLAAVGAVLIAAGASMPVDDAKMISGYCYGLGAAALTLGIGGAIVKLTVVEDGETMRRKDIEVNDERNTRIREKVGSKVNSIIVLAISAVVILLPLIGADITIILVVSSLLLLELVLAIYLTQYYSSRM